eukprot:2748447-Prymnesium_polylepis.1
MSATSAASAQAPLTPLAMCFKARRGLRRVLRATRLRARALLPSSPMRRMQQAAHLLHPDLLIHLLCAAAEVGGDDGQRRTVLKAPQLDTDGPLVPLLVVDSDEIECHQF